MISMMPEIRSGRRPSSARRAALLVPSLLLAAFLASFFVPSAFGQEREVWSVSELRTSFAFKHELLERIGLAVQDLDATGEPLDHHYTSVSAGRDVVFAGVISPSLELEVTRHIPQRFIGTVLHQGGFRLAGAAGHISFTPFSLRSGTETRTLEILSSDGEVIFYADHMHFSLERTAGRLRSFNLDLRLAPALTERLDAPALTGTYVGTLALEANFPPRAEDPPLEGACGEWEGDVDVQLTSIGNVDQVVQSDGLVGIAPSAELKNVGTADVPWWRKFTGPFPPYDNDQHPYLTWAFYRMTDQRIEQLAVSDIKHAFLTLNFGCDPGEDCDSHILGLGCEDVYGSSTNDSRSHLSHRDEIESRQGLWTGTGSHFDPDNDGVQEHPPQNPDGTFDHRLLVKASELEDAGADYFMHAFYIIRDDVDIFNSMAYRQVTPTDFGSFWSFPTSGGTINGTVLDAWIDPNNPPADSANTTVVDGAGHVQLAARATPVEGGLRYEYALLNHDYDPQISSFTVPLSGEPAFDITFRDLDDDPTNDWQVSMVDDSLVWTLPAGASGSDAHTGGIALDWGLMYNFAFTVYGGTTKLDRASFQPLGSPGQQRIQTVMPVGDSGVLFADGFETGDATRWSETVP